MKLFAVMKTQGEDRVRNAQGRLEATRQQELKAAIVVDGKFLWWGKKHTTIDQCKRAAEDLAGRPLIWHGFPDFGGLHKSMAESSLPYLKAVAEWR